MLSDRFLDERLYRAFDEARKGKTGTVDESKFELRLVENILQLREDIKARAYAPSRSTAFISHNPVDREIFAAPFRDRVIHHFVCDFIMDWWDRRLIEASYSCRKGRGTDAGIRDLYRKMRKVSENFTKETVVIKIDLSSYFCSIPRAKLYDRVHWGLKKQFLCSGHSWQDEEIYGILRYLCKAIIFDNPVRGARLKGSQRDWRNYPWRKSLFHQPPGIGIVIGNLTSQMFSNIYLDQLDRFVLLDLGIKNYGRYVDDAFFVVPEEKKREFLKKDLPRVIDLLIGMELRINRQKTFCQNIQRGIPFLGAILYPYRILPGNRLVRNFRNTVTKVQAGEKELECLVSYLGHMKHMDAQKIIAKIFEEHGLEYNYCDSMAVGSGYYTR